MTRSRPLSSPPTGSGPLDGHDRPTREELDRVLVELRSTYGSRTAVRENRPVLDAVIATILAQSTTHMHATRAMAALKTRFGDWHEARGAPRREIEDAIFSAGLASLKATRIKQLLDHVYDVLGRRSLEHVRTLAAEDARALLLALPGIGPKSAAHVMSFVLGRPDFPLGTHELRVASRLGWLPDPITTQAAYDHLRDRVPDACKDELRLLLLAHGRGTCRAKRPHCDACVLRAECPARRTHASEG